MPSEQKMIKDFTEAAKQKEKAPGQDRRIMCEEAERRGVRPKLQPLYAHSEDFWHACRARVLPDALCPGYAGLGSV